MDDIFKVEQLIESYFESTEDKQKLFVDSVGGYMPKSRYICQFDSASLQEIKALYRDLEELHKKEDKKLNTQSSKVPVFPEQFGDVLYFKITRDEAYKVTTYKLNEWIQLFDCCQGDNESSEQFSIRSHSLKSEYQKQFNCEIKVTASPNKSSKEKHLFEIKCSDLLLAIGEKRHNVTIRQRQHTGTQLTLACYYSDRPVKRFPAFRVALSEHYRIIDLSGVPRKKRKDAGKNREPILFNGERIFPELWIVKLKNK